MGGSKIAAGILLALVGLFLTVYYADTIGAVPIYGPIYTAIGLGVYFLGLDLAINGVLDRKTVDYSTQINQINQRLKNIDESMNRIEEMVKKWDFI